MQSLLKSRILKNLGGNLSLELPQLVIIPNGENTQLFETIGKSYSRDKLNIFDWGVTIDFPKNFAFGKFENVWTYKNASIAWLIDGIFTKNIGAELYYFGCDYVLPDVISVSQIKGVSVKDAPKFSSYDFNVSKIVASDNNFSVGKNRGLFSALDSCGEGWKYYYSINGSDFH